MSNTIDLLGEQTAVAKLIDKSVDSFEDNMVTSIGNNAFDGCSQLTDVSFPAVTSIGSYAFNSCSQLTNVSFPAVTSIGIGAFYGCSQLTDISFPAVTSIGGNAFGSCSRLTKIILENTEQVATLASTSTIPSNTIIYVPDALVDSYKAATNWSTLANRIKGMSELPA